jgi:Family of unknown function (DUF6064)
MSQWWTYRLSDLLLFSPRVYYRQFELLNQAFWPAHLFLLGLAIGLFFLLLRPAPARSGVVAGLLGAVWFLVGWAFLWERYAAVNWAMLYIAPAFGLQGALLLAVAASPVRLGLDKTGGLRRWLAVGLFGIAVAIYPLLAPAFGRSWLAAEVFGLAPDPTAVATLSVLVACRTRFRWLLAVAPMLWCAITGMTLWTMGTPDFWIAPAGALIALVGMAVVRRPDRRR